jgi:hypothetical protein
MKVIFRAFVALISRFCRGGSALDFQAGVTMARGYRFDRQSNRGVVFFLIVQANHIHEDCSRLVSVNGQEQTCLQMITAAYRKKAEKDRTPGADVAKIGNGDFVLERDNTQNSASKLTGQPGQAKAKKNLFMVIK